MSRLIDADELKKNSDINNWYKPYGCSFDVIDNMPTIVDAVEVVRCKDCIHSFMTIDGEHAKYCDMFDSDDGVYFDKNHFCSYGERKGE